MPYFFEVTKRTHAVVTVIRIVAVQATVRADTANAERVRRVRSS